MNYEKLLNFYKSELNDLFETVNELQNKEIIDSIKHDIFIDDLIELSEKRKLLKKYKNKESLLNQDKRLLTLLESIKNFKDKRSRENFLKTFNKYLSGYLPKTVGV